MLRTKDGIGGSFAKGTWKRELMERSPRSPRLRININDIEAGLAKFLATPSFTDIDAAQLPSLDELEDFLIPLDITVEASA